jgi:endonuclease-8
LGLRGFESHPFRHAPVASDAVPEGDTIRRLAERINRRFAGQRVHRCVTRDPRLVGVDLTGRVLVDADAVGKHLLIRFDDGRTLHAHLLMTGSWRVGPVATEPEWRRRVELWLDDGRLTGLDVPLLGIIATAQEASVVGHLGPDLCAPELPDLAEVAANLAGEPDRPLAAALLDQRNVAGWGNLYANELPFIVGVSPRQAVGAIGGLDDLVAVGAALIRTNAERGPQNTTGRRLGTDDHWIYRRRGRPCPLCATRLAGLDERDSPWQRVTTWCPTCQPLGTATTADVARARRLLALHPARRQPMFP